MRKTINISVSEDMASTPKGSTDNDEAFQLYLKGEFYRQKATPGDLQKAIEMYEKAVSDDPNYALAYQGLALA